MTPEERAKQVAAQISENAPCNGDFFIGVIAAAIREAEAVARAETREHCAQLCDQCAERSIAGPWKDAAEVMARIIRSEAPDA